MPDLTRRELTAMIGPAALLLTYGCTLGGAADPFTLGVSSGDPAPEGMVIWTRLAPRPFEPGGGMPRRTVEVRWEITEDERFAKVRSGTAVAEPAWGHSVHVEIGGLRSDRPHFYRFIVNGIVSPIGRTRTAPAPGAIVDRLRIAFASCQHYEFGHYAAYHHMVADDPDLIVFLGDYIYETDPGEGDVRQHRNARPMDLEGYRQRYATYKLDPLLQSAHHAAPWIVTWDDHEVSDNYANALDNQNDDPVAFLRRRAAAYQAYYEHMPLRQSARPTGPAMQLYRTIDWGSLAQFQVIDDRQYRDPPPCQAPGAIAAHIATKWIVPDCAERREPGRSILGPAQEQWLGEQLKSTQATWNLLTQQTLMLPYRRYPSDVVVATPDLYALDTWAGYPAARDRIVRQWRDARTPNPLILSGDIHAFVAADHADTDDPRRIVATEFVGGSMTSPCHDLGLERAAMETPGCRFANGVAHGYGRVDLAPQLCEVTFRAVGDVRNPNSAIADLAHFTVEAGSPGLHIT